MKKITRNELNEILEEHKKWLHRNGGKQADLSGADLSGANYGFGDEMIPIISDDIPF